ncbi:MAG: hypothetical protein HY290_25730 [Planctomycetia bacterium]|nr:hypothetical protein [Planctomycetia bacterium]
MQVLFNCPGCEQTRLAAIDSQTETIGCPECRWSRPIPPGAIQAGAPQACLVCGCGDLWRQKDFPQKLGLAIVALGGILSTIAFSLYMPLTSLGVLLAFALADLLLFTFMKDVLVCYSCHARYRNAELRDDHPRFNLETAERYRQEAARLENSRHAAGSPP